MNICYSKAQYLWKDWCTNPLTGNYCEVAMLVSNGSP